VGNVREIRSGTGVYFEYRLDAAEAFRRTWVVVVVGIAFLTISVLADGPRQSFLTPGSGFGVILIVVGVMSFVRWCTATWVLGANAVARQHRWGDSKKVDLHQLKYVRINPKWWSVKDRMGNRCLVPADTLQQVQVVQGLAAGVRRSLETGPVDMDAATALLLSSTDDQGGVRIPLDQISAAQTPTISPVLSRALNVWAVLVGLVLVVAVVVILVAML
jgi:hypothetical protein